MTTPDPVTVTRELIRDLHPIGTALVDCASRLAAIKELLPARGELVDEFRELVTTLAWVEATYRNADEALLHAYTLLEHGNRVPNPKPLNGHT